MEDKDSSMDRVGLDLVKQMAPTRIKKKTAVKKQKKRGRGLKGRLQEKIQHAKEIEKNPSAFSDSHSISTINQNNTLNQFNPHNPQEFKKKHKAKIIKEIENYREINEEPPAPIISDVDLISMKEAELMAELNELEQYTPQIRKVETFVGVKRGYRHTEDFLNKQNPDYLVRESLGIQNEFQVENSVNKLDQLLLIKKHNKAIPFISNYTPSHSNRSKSDYLNQKCEDQINGDNKYISGVQESMNEQDFINSHNESLKRNQINKPYEQAYQKNEMDDTLDEDVTLGDEDINQTQEMSNPMTMNSIITTKSYNPKRQIKQKIETYGIQDIVQEESGESSLQDSPYMSKKTEENISEIELEETPKGYLARERLRVKIKKTGIAPNMNKKGDHGLMVDSNGFKSTKGGQIKVKEGINLEELFLS